MLLGKENSSVNKSVVVDAPAQPVAVQKVETKEVCVKSKIQAEFKAVIERYQSEKKALIEKLEANEHALVEKINSLSNYLFGENV